MSRIVKRDYGSRTSSHASEEFALLTIWALAGLFLTAAMGLSATPAAMLMIIG